MKRFETLLLHNFLEISVILVKCRLLDLTPNVIQTLITISHFPMTQSNRSTHGFLHQMPMLRAYRMVKNIDSGNTVLDLESWFCRLVPGWAWAFLSSAPWCCYLCKWCVGNAYLFELWILKEPINTKHLKSGTRCSSSVSQYKEFMEVPDFFLLVDASNWFVSFAFTESASE